MCTYFVLACGLLLVHWLVVNWLLFGFWVWYLSVSESWFLICICEFVFVIVDLVLYDFGLMDSGFWGRCVSKMGLCGGTNP